MEMYDKLEMEVVRFDAEDIITASGGNQNQDNTLVPLDDDPRP